MSSPGGKEGGGAVSPSPPPTGKEAVQFVCKVLHIHGITSVNPEVFRRASCGKADMCPALWKALHDLLLLELLGRDEALAAQENTKEMLSEAWRLVVGKNGSRKFHFDSVVYFVCDNLIEIGYPFDQVRELVGQDKDSDDDAHGLLLALCFCIAKFCIVERYVLIEIYGRSPAPASGASPGAKDAKKQHKNELAFWGRLPLPFRDTYSVDLKAEKAPFRGGSLSGSIEWKSMKALELPSAYETVQKQLRDTMCAARNAYVRLGRALGTFEKYNATVVSADPHLKLESPLALALFLYGRHHRSPRRVDSAIDGLVRNCKDGNRAMALSMGFWDWCSRVASKRPVRNDGVGADPNFDRTLLGERLEEAMDFIEANLGLRNAQR